jgi:hypothetical protein
MATTKLISTHVTDPPGPDTLTDIKVPWVDHRDPEDSRVIM